MRSPPLSRRKREIQRLYLAQKGICYLCGERMILKLKGSRWKMRDATVEHVVPLNKGGTNTPENKRAAHKICNSMKASLSVEESRCLFVNGMPQTDAGRRETLRDWRLANSPLPPCTDSKSPPPRSASSS